MTLQLTDNVRKLFFWFRQVLQILFSCRRQLSLRVSMKFHEIARKKGGVGHFHRNIHILVTRNPYFWLFSLFFGQWDLHSGEFPESGKGELHSSSGRASRGKCLLLCGRKEVLRTTICFWWTLMSNRVDVVCVNPVFKTWCEKLLNEVVSEISFRASWCTLS